jgi:hypothetical protein
VAKIPFVGDAYTSRSANFASARTVNYYIEVGGGKDSSILIGCPGLTAPWLTLTGGGMRGMFGVDDSTAIMVCGGSVYKVNTSAGTTLIGSIPDDDRPVQIVGSGQDILITSANSLYALTLTGSSSTLLLTDIGMVDLLDDHFVANKNTTNQYVWSDAVTTTFDPLNIQADNSAPDVLVGLKVARRTMYLLGRKAVRSWYDQGGTDNPFARIDGGTFEVGCIAKDSIAEMDAVFWVAGDDKGAGSVWSMVGGQPSRVSTPAIEYALSQWPDLSDAEAFTYSQEGHSFYVLSSVSGNQTWAYDVTTGKWHQRAWLHPSGNLHRIRPRCHLYFAGKNLVGDWETGDIYEYSLDTYSDNGIPLPAIRATQTIQNELQNQNVGTLQLDMDTGVGLTDGPGSNPQAMLRWSRDGGKTYGNAIWRSFGEIGEYGQRAIWFRVGGGARMVFEVTITDAVKRNICGAYFE